MNSYKVINKQIFSSGDYSLVPIRYEDRYNIMKWRNEQIFHLRQNKLLTKQDQDNYFNNVIAQLFDNPQPQSILFSFLKDSKSIGYGGLVHINWIDKNAEVSFLMDTSLESDFFSTNWSIFLSLLEQVAFEELDFHKIFTYAFDVRPKLYSILEQNGFKQEANLEGHCYFEGKFIDIKIHSKFCNKFILKRATIEDLDITFLWANDEQVRKYAYKKNLIKKNDHLNWFKGKISSDTCEYYILTVNGEPVGSIRFDIEEASVAKISYLIDPNHTGRGYGSYLLKEGEEKLLQCMPGIKKVYGHVFNQNQASIRIFEKLGYKKEFVSGNSSVFHFEKIVN